MDDDETATTNSLAESNRKRRVNTVQLPFVTKRRRVNESPLTDNDDERLPAADDEMDNGILTLDNKENCHGLTPPKANRKPSKIRKWHDSFGDFSPSTWSNCSSDDLDDDDLLNDLHDDSKVDAEHVNQFLDSDETSTKSISPNSMAHVYIIVKKEQLRKALIAEDDNEKVRLMCLSIVYYGTSLNGYITCRAHQHLVQSGPFAGGEFGLIIVDSCSKLQKNRYKHDVAHWAVELEFLLKSLDPLFSQQHLPQNAGVYGDMTRSRCYYFKHLENAGDPKKRVEMLTMVVDKLSRQEYLTPQWQRLKDYPNRQSARQTLVNDTLSIIIRELVSQTSNHTMALSEYVNVINNGCYVICDSVKLQKARRLNHDGHQLRDALKSIVYVGTAVAQSFNQRWRKHKHNVQPNIMLKVPIDMISTSTPIFDSIGEAALAMEYSLLSFQSLFATVKMPAPGLIKSLQLRVYDKHITLRAYDASFRFSALSSLLHTLLTGEPIEPHSSIRCHLCPWKAKSARLMSLQIRQMQLIDHHRNFHGFAPVFDDCHSCHFCGKRFSDASSMLTHLDITHPRFFCRIGSCEYQCFNGHAYEAHGYTAHSSSPRRFPCPEEGCGKSYTTNQNLQTHISSVHSTTRQHKCPKQNCSKSFKTNQHLRAHIKEVHSTTRHQCPKQNCSKSFKTNQLLRRHIDGVHSTTRHQCPKQNCSKSFKTHQHLRRHISSAHSASRRRFPCPEEGCGKSYTSNDSLRRHISSAHSASPRRFPCREEGCTKTFTAESSLRRHIRKHHP